MLSISIKKIIPLFLFALFSIALFKTYNAHVAAFGCFDECFNYVAGHFILKGRVLYSEIFFNHQMLMAYVSSIIQMLFRPESIYHLVLEHRMFVFFFGLAMDVLIMWRFGMPGVFFAFLFEATKFYFMGSLFLPESILVYPLVYMFGLVWQKRMGKKLLMFDYIASAIMAWFIIFLREPLFLVTVFLFVLISVDVPFRKKNVASIGAFCILSFVTLLFTALPDYIFQVVALNSKTAFLSEVSSYGNIFSTLTNIFFYPAVILFNGVQSFLREILIAIDIIFLIGIAVFLQKSRKKSLVLLLVILLGLANLRVVPPGFMFYEAFHMLPWYGLFLLSTFLLLEYVYTLQHMKKLSLFLTMGAVSIFTYATFSPQSFFHDKIDREREFGVHFDRYYIYGEAIKSLAKPQNTLFLEGWDDLIYWKADLLPAYRYIIYKYTAGISELFAQERMEMFRDSPPDFYYSVHEKGVHLFGFLPQSYVNDYIELMHADKPSGLYIKKSKLPTITSEQWEKANALKFSLPGI